MPISVSAWPSKPTASESLSSSSSPPRPSIQASNAANLPPAPRSAIAWNGKLRWPPSARTGRAHRACPARACPAQAPATDSPGSRPGAVTSNGRSPPTSTLTRPSGIDADRHVGVDQAEALGARACDQQARAGNADLGLGRHRHRRAAGVAQHDVAQAQRGAALLVALELRAADLDAIAAAEILLDRGGEPGRRQIEHDRAAGEPPPQRAAADQHQHGDHGHGDRGLAHHRMPAVEQEPGIERQPPSGAAQPPQPAQARSAAVGMRRRAGFRLRAPMRIQRRLHFLERRDARTAILVRHARSAVPSSAGLDWPVYRSRLPANRFSWRRRDFARNPTAPPLPSHPMPNSALTRGKRRKEGA